jgi:hypothetical protein
MSGSLPSVRATTLGKEPYTEEIQINELNLLAIENNVIIVPKWYM